MEETWEFAVVMSDNADKDKCTCNADKEKFTWEWSPKHTRLRYQLVVSAFLFASFCRFDATSFHLPLSIAEFSEMPPQWEFISVTLLFYIFTLVSFYYRSRNERNTLDVSESEFLKVTKDFKKTIDEFSLGLSGEGSRSYQGLIGLINKPKVIEAQALINLKDADAVTAELLGSLKPAEEILSSIIIEMFDRISMFFPEYNNNPAEMSKQHNFIDLVDIVSKMQRSNEPYNALSQLQSVIKRLESSRGFSNSDEAIVDYYVSVISDGLKDVRVLCEQEATKFQEIEDRLNNSDKFNIENLRLAITKLNKDADERHNYKRFDREYLGFWVPLIVSVLVVLMGFYFLVN